MDTVKQQPTSSNVSALVRTFAKVLRFKTVGIAPDDGTRKNKLQDKFDDEHYRLLDEEERIQNKEAMDALLAKVFASISSVKAAYAELQFAQSPYDVDVIQAADGTVVNELKLLSELKQCYLKKQIDPSSPSDQLLAEIKEQKSLLKTYEIMGKKFESQLKNKDSEIQMLKEKFEELENENRWMENRLKSGRYLNSLGDLHLSGLNPNHFNTVLRHTVKSIRNFVKLMTNEMEASGWDLDAAARSIEAEIKYMKPSHRCFVFESFVCREMFDGFKYREFSLLSGSEQKQTQRYFFEAFMEMKSGKPKEFLARNSKSPFAKFCRVKYLQLVHPKMESSLFGDLKQRNLVNSFEYPDTHFFATFAEMAQRVWLLHCLAFSFKPEASIFQMRKGCRFSDVYMESVTEDAFATFTASPVVSFTVVPGFQVGKVVIQAQVYLSPS